MNEIILSGIITIATTVTGSFVSYMLARKKYSAEVSSNYIKNIEDGLVAYTKFKDTVLADLKASEERNDLLEEENKKSREERKTLNDKIDKLTEENALLKKKVDTLTEDNSKMHEIIEKLERSVQTLTNEIKTLNTKKVK